MSSDPLEDTQSLHICSLARSSSKESHDARFLLASVFRRFLVRREVVADEEVHFVVPGLLP
jgi:hypothetical protein